MTCSSYGSGSMEVQLHRAWGWGNDYIGSVWFDVNGFSKGAWSNVGAGNYYFLFKNPTDSWVNSGDVAMFSW